MNVSRELTPVLDIPPSSITIPSRSTLSATRKLTAEFTRKISFEEIVGNINVRADCSERGIKQSS